MSFQRFFKNSLVEFSLELFPGLYNTVSEIESGRNSCSAKLLAKSKKGIDGSELINRIIDTEKQHELDKINRQDMQRLIKNVEITIKAGTPIASLLPISLSGLNNSEVNLKSMFDLEPGFFPGEDYGKIVHDINSSGRWTNFYRDAVDHKGKKIGDHEVKSLRLKVNDGKPEMCNDK